MTSYENQDELEPRNGGTMRPPALPPDATFAEVIEAINILARAADTQAVELELIRKAVQEQGTRLETFCQRIERALGAARERTTDPAPAG